MTVRRLWKAGECGGGDADEAINKNIEGGRGCADDCPQDSSAAQRRWNGTRGRGGAWHNGNDKEEVVRALARRSGNGKGKGGRGDDDHDDNDDDQQERQRRWMRL